MLKKPSLIMLRASSLLRMLRRPASCARATCLITALCTKYSSSIDTQDIKDEGEFTRRYWSQFPLHSLDSRLQRLLRQESVAQQPKVLITSLQQQRGIVQLKGDDTVKLLQGITTREITKAFANAPNLEAATRLDTAVSTHMLNARGRVQFDVIISRAQENVFLVECAGGLEDQLIEHIGRYKLRNKVSMSKESDVYILHVLPCIDVQTGKADLEGAAAEVGKLLTNLEQNLDVHCFPDPRLDTFGYRLYVRSLTPGSVTQKEELKQLLAKNEMAEIVLDETSVYDQWRMLNGIPEGNSDLPPGESLPLEANADLLDSVSFDKGCYVGQELTARTHFQGEIRKRIVPVFSTSATGTLPTPGEKLLLKSDLETSQTLSDMATEQSEEEARMRARRINRGVGRMCSSSGPVGLALVQMDHMDDPLAAANTELRAVEPIYFQ